MMGKTNAGPAGFGRKSAAGGLSRFSSRALAKPEALYLNLSKTYTGPGGFGRRGSVCLVPVEVLFSSQCVRAVALD